MTKGQCLCGAVTFTGRIDDPAVTACHCGQCRKWSGHVWAAFQMEDPQISGPVRWYRSSDFAARGFCPECGSSLFWRMDGREVIAVAPSAIDNPNGLRMAGHIYVADKGDYYQIADDLPQKETY